MYEIVNKFLLAGDKFMPEMNLRDAIVDHFLKTRKGYRYLKKQEI